jgi:hypothetical protein
MIFMVIFPRNGDDFELRADVNLAGKGEVFRGFWGWPDSRGFLANVEAAAPPPPANVAAAAPPPPLPRAEVRPARPRASPKPPTSWDVVRASVTFRREQGRLVAPVQRVLAELKADTKHVGEAVQRVKRRHSFDDRHVFKTARLGGKLGGTPEWVAVESFLKSLCDLHRAQSRSP